MIVPLVIFDYGSVTARFKQIRYKRLANYFTSTLKEMANSASSIQNNPYTDIRPLTVLWYCEMICETHNE